MENEEIIAELLKLNASINAIYKVLTRNGLATFEELKAIEHEIIALSKTTLANVQAPDEHKRNVLGNLD